MLQPLYQVVTVLLLLITIGVDPVGVRGVRTPIKNLVVGSSMAQAHNENFTKINLISAK